MKTSKNLKFQIPELDDQANVTVIGNALEVLDDAAGDALAMNGDASTAQVTFERATTRENITSKETFRTLMSKISRWFADLKDAAFASIANNDTTTASGYVADARIVKTHGDEIDTLNTKNGGLYFGQNSAGKWGYKTSANGTVNPFRNPAGNAVAGDVLAGKTFANADSDSVTGTMTNNGVATKNITPSDASTTELALEGYYAKGSKVVADGSVAYNAGFTAGYGRFDKFSIVLSQSVRNAYQGAVTRTLSIPSAGHYLLWWHGNGIYMDEWSVDADYGIICDATETSFREAGVGYIITGGAATITIKMAAPDVDDQRNGSILFKLIKATPS